MRWVSMVVALGFAWANAALAQFDAPAASVSAHLNQTAIGPGNRAAIAVVINIPNGLHAQSRTPLQDNIPLEVAAQAGQGVTVGSPIYPPGEIKDYKLLGKLSVYSGRAIVYVPLEVAPDAAPGPVEVRGSVSYQMCDDKLCYPPQSLQWKLQTQIVAGGEARPANEQLFSGYDPNAATTAPATARPSHAVAAPSITSGLPPAVANYQVVSAEDYLNERSTGIASFGGALILALGAGLLFNVMPCVLPVLPIKAIGFYETAQHNRARSIAFGGVFALGLISVFAVLGGFILAGKLTWGEQFSNPYFVWAIVAILVVMSLGLFGLFDVRLPSSIYSITPRHDTYRGNFLFGVLTAVLATPCTAPLLPAVVAFALTLPGIFGMAIVISVGVGMALPYFLLSAFPGLARRFPRSGPWPALFKQVMGFLVLGTAVYFAGGQIAAGNQFYWAIAAVGLAGAIFLVTRTAQLSRFSPVAMGVATVLAVALGGGPLWLALHMNSAPAGSASLAWEPYMPGALQQRLTGGQPTLVKFTASWCGTCQYIEGTVFKDAQVAAALKQQGVSTLKVDFSHANPDGQLLLKTLSRSGGIPVTAVYAPELRKVIKFESVYNSEDLLRVLNKVSGTPVARGG